MCLNKYLTMTFATRLPAKINNPVFASQVGLPFQQYRVIERVCVEGINKCGGRGAL